jgi:diphthamide biosynthesis enzyme Dph1/Dph2-like protein
METLFIEARRKFKDSDIDWGLLNKVPGRNVSLAATIQYIDLVPKAKAYLERLGKNVVVRKGAYYDGHVLGCNSSALDRDSESILVITDGTFHAINNAIQLQRPVYIFTTNTLEKIEQRDIDIHNKKTLTKQKKFLMADNVGLLVSTKHGQNQKAIHKVKKNIEKTGKRAYVFESNNINIAEFENFPQIQIWVNTACFGIGRDDMRVINLADILEFLN